MNEYGIVVLVDLDDRVERTELIVSVPKEYSLFSFKPMIEHAIQVVKNCEDYTGLTNEEIEWIEKNEFGRDDGYCEAFIWYLENAYHFKCEENKNKVKSETFMVLF